MVLVYAESPKGQFKKSAFEAVAYGKMVADIMGKSCTALVMGNADNAGQLGKYGASKVVQANGDFENFDSQIFADVITNAAKEMGAEVIILNHSSTGKSLLGRLAVKLDAGSVSGVNSLPTIDGVFKVKKNVFSGKAIAEYEVKTAVKVLSLMGNSFPLVESGADVAVESINPTIPAAKVIVKSLETVEGIVPLPEAELVVSAGRGMKGPENWGIIDELAVVVGATTACSRPVADIGWRPHHEHVGQTGVAIRPNLYFAIGISGAIQHLAGVNSSKVIVVINKDPEAPFFKAADYGVCADLFDVVPKLTEAFKKFNAAQ
jgi:electron transfer flavoprotein alpha subunit